VTIFLSQLVIISFGS